MNKLLIVFCGLLVMACNNQASNTTKSDSTGTAPATANMPKTVLSKESEMEILASCVDNAKANLGEAKAFVLCKCILGQVQEKYPNADSTALVDHLADTAEIAQMAPKCK